MIRIKSLPKEIKVGKQIQILKTNKKGAYLVSQILDIINDEEIVISGPIKKNNLIFVHKGELIKLHFTVENRGVYYFTAKVLSKEYSPIYTLTIERISEINKIQNREYFRLLSGLPVDKEHQVFKNGAMDSYKEKCKAKDISGGGMKIYCNFEHKLNDLIYCIIEIEDLMIKTKAIVKRVERIDTFDYEYSIGVFFLGMKESNRDEIIRYIFERQRILRYKGLI